MNTATSGSLIRLKYTIRLDSGKAYPPAIPDDSFQFELGKDRVLPGIERAVEGMKPGDYKNVRVAAADAFGPRLADKCFRIPRSESAPNGEKLQVGDVVRVFSASEGSFLALVEQVDDEFVLVDANHPLSGQDLTFEIEVLEVLDRCRQTALVA